MSSMLKQADFYSELTTSQDPIWKDNWDNTLNALSINTNISKLNGFLTPEILSHYLPPPNSENYRERTSVIKKLFEQTERIIGSQIYNSDDPEMLSLLMKLPLLQKLYDAIPYNYKNSALILGESVFSGKNFAGNLAHGFGYDTLTYLARSINFSPRLIMQVARGIDIQNNSSLEGREKLVAALKQKYNGIYEILESPELTKHTFGDQNAYNKNGMDEDDTHLIYKDLDYDPDYNINRIRDSIASNMDPKEYAQFLINLIETNYNNDPILEIPLYSWGFPIEHIPELMEELNNKGLISFFLNVIHQEDIQEKIQNIPYKGYSFIFRFNEAIKEMYPGQYNWIKKIIPLYQIINNILSSKLDFDAKNKVTEIMENDFSWINLEQNHQAAMNGFGTPEQLLDFFTKNPSLLSSCKVYFPGKEELEEKYLIEQQEEIVSQKNIYEYALKEGVFSFEQGINTTFDNVGTHLLEEAPKLGINPEEFKAYAHYIKVYKVNPYRWGELCQKAKMPDTSFLGSDLSKITGSFKSKAIDHEGNFSPIIILTPNETQGPIQILFDYLGINSKEMQQATFAHEGAHALNYLADPSMLENSSYDPSEGSIGSYIGSVPESIAYAHGTLPYFYNLIQFYIVNKLDSPVVQNAIRSWILSNVLSSDDAALQGFYSNKELMKQALILEEKFGVDIQEYIEKKKNRQIQKIYQLTQENQEEHKQLILKDLIEEEKELKEKQKILQDIIEKEKKLNKNQNNTINSSKLNRIINKIKSLETRKKLISKNLLSMDLNDAAEALAEGFIRDYFIEFSQQAANNNPQAIPASKEELEDQTRFIMDATFGGNQQYRPLTTEILPLTTTPIDRSLGFYPHFEERGERKFPYLKEEQANSYNKIIRIANILDKNKQYKLADKIDKLF